MANRSNQRRWQRKASSRGLKDNLHAIAYCALAVFLVVCIAGYYFSKLEANASIDPLTFCKKGTPDQVTVILLDHTDKYNAVQKADLEKILWNIADNVPKNTWLKLVSVTADTEHLLAEQKPFCNPGDENTVSSLDGSKQRAKILYEQKYKKQIKDTLDSMLESTSSNNSPIMEALQAVAITTFKGPDAPKVKKLILVSDLLQHTKDFSMYKGIPEFEKFKEQNYWKSVKSDFQDVEVEIYLIHRADSAKIQNAWLKNFWKYYFIEQNSQGSPEVKDIDGQS